MRAAAVRGFRMLALNVAVLAAAWVVWDFTARAAHSSIPSLPILFNELPASKFSPT